MTKEEFIANIKDMCIYGGDTVVATEFLNQFFESNICIPKGENRHPYADVLHQAIERGNLQKRYQIGDINNQLKTKWIDFNLGIGDEFRIKHSEPIYEWQYAFDNGHSNPQASEQFYTDEEYDKYVDDREHCIKLPWTKRERK